MYIEEFVILKNVRKKNMFLWRGGLKSCLLIKKNIYIREYLNSIKNKKEFFLLLAAFEIYIFCHIPNFVLICFNAPARVKEKFGHLNYDFSFSFFNCDINHQLSISILDYQFKFYD